MQSLFHWLPEIPILTFTLLLLVSLTVPPWFERLNLPGLVGLIAAGIVLGQHGLGLLDAESESMKLFSDIGKIYLMFVAGLEIDLLQFRRNKNRSLGFGLVTFLVPLITGTIIGLAFDFNLTSSILIGSLLSSHTLLGYPIVQRFGLVETEAATVGVGATILTDISALLVLAICVSVQAGDFSWVSLIVQLVVLGIYMLLIFFGFDWAGKAYFRQTGEDEGSQFLFVLLAVFLASLGAEIINVDKIVGAFLAGLAVNDVVGNSSVKEKVEFFGSVLFIPFFFVGMGLLLNVPLFINTLLTSFELTLAIIIGLLGSKFFAALLTKLFYGYSWAEMGLLWSLSIPQVAATLAAALVGLNVGLISEEVFNGIIVLMLVTSIVGPMLTSHFAPKIMPPQIEKKLPQIEENSSFLWWENPPQVEAPFTVVVPVSTPETERKLMAIAALLTRHESGIIIPLAITYSKSHMDDPELQQELKQSHKLLVQAEELGQSLQVTTHPKLRIASDIGTGIVQTACEENARLIIMGWSKEVGLRTWLFGNVLDQVLGASHCPVAVVRLQSESLSVGQILVPVRNLTPQTVRTVRFAQLLAETNQARVRVLHVCPAKATPERVKLLEQEFLAALQSDRLTEQLEVAVIPSDKVAEVIIAVAEEVDLVVLRSLRRRTTAGLAVSDVVQEAILSLQCSLVLFSEPYRG
ncbi:cation:proton antiporter [Spirulina sp. CS-785/01]|uniref:cation:proton antiporter n=1 Tax=Spirulina sp. CS-785/01 TaxID=3021716 RepID=UPI002330AAAB|nr:cation:proton antiporter [Spirulina sp. CS-785/01]MDB9311496.1 cation:proton antiporter [Spirulina sp. CS-785/01]